MTFKAGSEKAPVTGAGRAVAIYGHRGARGIFPENTMPGFAYTLDIGIRGIEIDVLLTSDLVPVVTHYPVLLAETTRDSEGRWLDADSPLVSDLTLEQLRKYDVGAARPGSAHMARFPDQARLDEVRVPTLEQVATLLDGRPDVKLNIEVKSYANRPEVTAPPAVQAREILAVLERHGLARQTLVSSFDWRVIHAFRDQAADIPRFYLSYLDRPDPPMEPNIFEGSPWMDGCSLAAHDGSLPQAVADLGGSGWCPHFGDLMAQDLARAHKLGLTVNTWTVNKADDIRQMAGLGVDGIISDYPARVQNILSESGYDWI